MARIGAVTEMSNPLQEAFRRGAEVRRKMLKAEGGVLSTQQFSEKLGITSLELARLRKRNAVFWLDHGDDYVFPSFQLDEKGLLHGISDVLEAFAFEEPLMRVNFMLTGDMRLGGWRPIDALREGRIDDVILAAQAYGEHGAA